ncbi:MAG: serine hydrolase [Candidatus Kerfeldbacteria bacterium]|nr:serine hydrolase [Candidatus Kerfeldbacteria bacterium]
MGRSNVTDLSLTMNDNSNQLNGASKKTLRAYQLWLGLAVAALILTYTVYVPNRKSGPVGSQSQYSLLNPSAALIEKKDLLVNFQSLRDRLTEKYERRDDYLVSLYFEYLPTGANVSINKDEKIWPASLIKIPVAMAAMKKVDTNAWKLDNQLVILDDDKDSEFGELYKQPTGTTMTIEEFLRESLVNSDNTAHFVLLRNLDGSELEDVYTHLGMDDIIDALKQTPKGAEADNRITAKRYSIFFRSLYNATYLTPEYSNVFLNILKDASREDLSAGLPSDVVFVHKTGIRIDERVWADSGIVYLPGRPYMLTVMIQQKGDAADGQAAVNRLFTDIAKEIYEYVAQAR